MLNLNMGHIHKTRNDYNLLELNCKIILISFIIRPVSDHLIKLRLVFFPGVLIIPQLSSTAVVWNWLNEAYGLINYRLILLVSMSNSLEINWDVYS